MSFDEQIRRTLEEKSNWSGSKEVLWEKVSSQLERKKPWWHRQSVWLSTAAVATLFLALVLHNILTPLPAEIVEKEAVPRIETFHAMTTPAEPEIIRVNEQLEIELDIYLAVEEKPEDQPRLLIWKTDGPDDLFIEEFILDPNHLLDEPTIVVGAPSELGSYRLTVQGTFRDEEQLYGVWAEKTILVKE